MNVELVSPEQVLWSGEATQVLTRTLDGDIAFLDGHAPFLGALAIGVVQIWSTDNPEPIRAAVHGGFIEVSNNTVSVLSDIAELAGDIDVERARAARDGAKAILAIDEHDSVAAVALERAETRLIAAGEIVDAH
ncbi:MAG: F0F1 ATP synthase subunit epsilon [Acidimicrobiales bacterium]|nr:F0F1 ATP synthase subunit epsilon [Acidimicrobiales bacterium]